MSLPPYFNLDPDQALAELNAPTSSADFQTIAQACAQGRQDLASRGISEEGRKSLRLFSTWEITRYLIPVAQAHFRRVLKQNPDLPQGTSETPGGAKWFTLDEVQRLRAFFGAQGSKAKDYLPYRPAGLPAKIVAAANFKGAYSIVEGNVKIGNDTVIGPHCVIRDNTSIGERNRIYQFCSVGEDPQPALSSRE